ncbi:MAG: hypothetical protein K6G17_08390 [Oscillospiraceae bacterium]|nr:hypothetical protein [Oscillospiraceae bacterium]
MKKIVSLLLAALLLFSLLSVSAFATGDTEKKEETTEKKVKITKSPTGETVQVGGRAVFIAYADNYTELIWRIVSNDTTETVLAKDAPDYFRGVKVEGLGTDTLVLSNIPASMNGWRVEARFEGPGGPVFSMGALITVVGAQTELKAPTISTQPQAASLTPGQTTTLSVSAATTTGSLRFQWYSNTTNSNVGGKAIEGATSSSFVPTEQTGTTYYYVTVKSVDGGRESAAVASSVAAVTYAAAAEPGGETGGETGTDEPAQTPTPLTPVVDGSETGTDAGTDEQPSDGKTEEPADSGKSRSDREAEDEDGSKSSDDRASNALKVLTIVGAVVAVAAVAGGVTAIVMRRRGSDEDEDDEDDYDDQQ